MKDFVEAYKEARAKAREYIGAKRAGWAEPGKRTRENHAILVPRREAVAMADELSTAVYAKEVYLFRALNLQGFMVQLATGEHDAMTCPECSRVFRAGWMNGQCPYCEAEQAAARYVEELLSIDESVGSKIYERSKDFYLCTKDKKNWRLLE